MTDYRRLFAALLATVFVALPVSGQAQAPAAPAARPADEVAVPITDSDLDRIRKALDSGPSIKIDDNQLRYYVEILAVKRSFAEYVKGYDLRNGPTKGGNPMTHQEFLTLVTPKELYSSSGGITGFEQLQWAVTNWLGQTLVKKAIEDLSNARSQKEIDEIRARIDRELAALKRDVGN